MIHEFDAVEDNIYHYSTNHSKVCFTEHMSEDWKTAVGGGV
jgi:hypothetical protein